jgi:chromate transporter
MLVGLTRGGPLGAFLAWLGFTAPSAIAMIAIAAALGGAERHQTPPWFGGLLAGLFAAAAAVVAQAVVGLAGSLCTDLPTKVIAVASIAVTLALRPYPGFQWVAIALGALTGALALWAPELRHDALPIRVPRPVAICAGIVFVAALAVTALPKTPTLAFIATLIRAGSLVFGGGHVVLPLLQSMIRDGLITAENFFAGYGAVQAMPGPLNTFSSFLGYANLSPLHGIPGALVATVLIFLPSFALIFAIAPVWNRVAGAPRAAGAVRGANASVVGLLGAVLYDPVLLSLGTSWVRIGIALAAFAAIALWRIAPWIVVVAAAVLGAMLGA